MEASTNRTGCINLFFNVLEVINKNFFFFLSGGYITMKFIPIRKILVVFYLNIGFTLI